MRDCAPRNVLREARTQKPFVNDLAKCLFKDKMIRE
jgi:hypothetical protein